jgi:hypothetical protein
MASRRRKSKRRASVELIGRVTITLLKMNDPIRVELRESLIEEDLFPRSKATLNHTPGEMV